MAFEGDFLKFKCVYSIQSGTDWRCTFGNADKEKIGKIAKGFLFPAKGLITEDNMIKIGNVVGNTSPQEYTFYLKSMAAKLGDLVCVEIEVPPDSSVVGKEKVLERILKAIDVLEKYPYS